MTRANVKFGLLTFVFILNSFFNGYSIGDQTQIGARDVSLGNASVALISPFSVFHNQAAFAWMKDFSVAIDYRQPYLIEGLAEKSLAAIIPTPISNFGFSIHQKGFAGYTESRFGLAMAKPLGKRISAGLQFNYFLVGFPEQGSSRSTFLLEFGVLFQTSKSLSFGVHIFNPSRATIESLYLQSDLPVSATTGLALKLSANLMFVSAITWCKDNPLAVKMGIEYLFSDCFFIRGGISGKPIRHSAGLGYRFRFATIDVAFMHHETLGYTPSLSLTLNF